MKQSNGKRIAAFSLAELLLAIGLFAILVSAVATFSIDSLRATKNTSTRVAYTQKTQEMHNALLLNKDNLWRTIIDRTDGDPFHLVFAANSYTIADGKLISDEATIYGEILQAYRDANDDLTLTPGNIDTHVRAIRLTTEWTDILGITNSFESLFFISDWKTESYEETTKSEFDTGTHDMTIVTEDEDGEVKMDTIVFADWCNPTLSMSQFDLPGQGYAKTIQATATRAMVGTGDNSSGLSLVNLGIVPTSNPTITVDGTFDGYKVNSIYHNGSTAYLASNTNSKEVIIVDLGANPHAEIGYFDAPGNANGYAIAVSGNYGYVSAGDYIYTFDLSSNTGERTLLHTNDAEGTVKKITINNGYLYAAIEWGSKELQIFSLANPAAPTLVGYANVNGSLGVSVDVNEAGTRAYLTTAFSFFYPEFFIIDITQKNGSMPIVGTYNASMWPRDVAVTKDFKRAIIVGILGNQQYHVLDIENESNPQYCGGMSVSSGIHGISAVKSADGNVFSYIITGSSSSELRIIRGGAGGGGGNGFGYPESATFISQVFDTTSETAQYYNIESDATINSNSSIAIQIRSSANSDMSGSVWTGSDGTNSTYYSVNNAVNLNASLSDSRYLQYRLYFTSSDQIHTSIFKRIEFRYQK